MDKKAVISECKKYRYSLSRVWDQEKPKVMFVMLNPSTADAYNDDPTIRRCIGFAKAWGYGGLIVCNLLAFRATNPKELLNQGDMFDVVGPDNIWHLRKNSDEADKIICAWGNGDILKKVFKGSTTRYFTDTFLGFALNRLHFLDISNKGIPKHPLYLPKDLKPIKFSL